MTTRIFIELDAAELCDLRLLREDLMRARDAGVIRQSNEPAMHGESAWRRTDAGREAARRLALVEKMLDNANQSKHQHLTHAA